MTRAVGEEIAQGGGLLSHCRKEGFAQRRRAAYNEDVHPASPGMRTLSPEDLERLAHKRAGAKLGWYVHAAVYLVVNLFLTGLSYFFGYTWTVYTVLGWGLGLALHGIAVFFLGAGSGVRDRLLRRERERLRRQFERSEAR